MHRSPRASVALARYRLVLEAPPEERDRAIEAWLESATPAEVRNGWKSWMGTCPVLGWDLMQGKYTE